MIESASTHCYSLYFLFYLPTETRRGAGDKELISLDREIINKRTHYLYFLFYLPTETRRGAGDKELLSLDREIISKRKTQL
jgi:hypothetical protein